MFGEAAYNIETLQTVSYDAMDYIIKLIFVIFVIFKNSLKLLKFYKHSVINCSGSILEDINSYCFMIYTWLEILKKSSKYHNFFLTFRLFELTGGAEDIVAETCYLILIFLTGTQLMSTIGF